MKRDRLNHRSVELLKALERFGGSARSADLAQTLGVSGETIRRTVASLERSGFVQRVHGGVLLDRSATQRDFSSRLGHASREKNAIVLEMANEVRDGMTVFIDASTTMSFMSKALSPFSGLTLVTNSIGLSQTLANRNGNRVHMLGGNLVERDLATYGSVAEAQLSHFAIDTAFISSDTLMMPEGFCYLDPQEASLMAEVTRCSDRVLLGLTHDKIGVSAAGNALPPAAIDVLYLDRGPTSEVAQMLEGAGISVQAVMV